MNMIDHKTMQIKVRTAKQYLMPKNIMNIYMYLMVAISIENKNFQGNASFHSFNHEIGNHNSHNLLLLIVIATETIKLILFNHMI